MGIRNYVGRGLANLALAGSLFLSGCEDIPKPANLERRLNQEVATQNHTADKYGVIISGNTNRRYEENLSIAYQVLLENGFQRGNIYILDNIGEKTAFYPVDDIASKEAIEMLFEHMAKKVDSEDLLFVYTTDHGGRISINEKVNGETKKIKISYLEILGGYLLETEMARYLSEVHPNIGVLVFDQCYSGGFAERTGRGNYIGISASETDKPSYSNTFPQTFFWAWRNKGADKNDDGRLSIREIFDYTLQNDERTKEGFQKPQIFSDMNIDEVFLK
nr:hypothetical protein [Nanoarchaeum sp.]